MRACLILIISIVGIPSVIQTINSIFDSIASNIADKAKSNKFFRGVKKQSNRNTGYKGRTAIHEILEVNSEMRNLIFDNVSQNEIKNLAIKNGMTPLREAGIGKIKSGVTTIEEIIRSTVEDN